MHEESALESRPGGQEDAAHQEQDAAGGEKQYSGDAPDEDSLADVLLEVHYEREQAHP